MKQTLKIFLLCLVCIIFSFFLTSEESEESKQRAILQFGLESEISELILKFQKNTITSFDNELFALFSKTKSPLIRQNILMLFTASKNESLLPSVLEVLADPYEQKSPIVLASLAYVAELRPIEASPLVRKILESENTQYRDRAILALGKIGNPEDAVYLLEFMQGDIPGDEKQRLVIRQNIMTALGDLAAVDTWDALVDIAKDEEENAVIRATAASALSKMGKIEAIEILVALYEETDPFLRTASISGLGNFSTVEANQTVIEGFKDSYYKVRIAAIEAVEKNKIVEAVPNLLYRAKNDPVESVKFRAIEALGKSNDASAHEWLSMVLNDSKAMDKVRVKVAGVLIENSFDLMFPDIEKIMMQSLSDDKKKSLRYELGKLIAKVESQKTSAIALAYLSHKDTVTRSIGLDMYEKNRYGEVKASVEIIAADEKQGAVQKRAKKLTE